MSNSTLILNGIVVDPVVNHLEFQSLHLSLDGNDSFEFMQNLDTPEPEFLHGSRVELTVSGRTHPDFLGSIEQVGESIRSADGWTIAYRALGGTWLLNQIVCTDPSALTGAPVYNRETIDPLYLPDEAGLSIGAMFKLVLDGHADQLIDQGISGYVQADLDALTITPPNPVMFAGKLGNAMQQILGQWQGTFALRVAWYEPTSDWRIRIVDTLTLPVVTLDFDPDADDPPPLDPETLQYNRDTSDSYTRVVIRGRANIVAAYLSTLDGTLTPAWTSDDQADWSWDSWANPSGAVSVGALTGVLSQEATCNPDDNTEEWTLNQWSVNHAKLYLINPITTLATSFDMRTISSNDALSPGSTGKVKWTGDQPLDAPNFTRYRIVGKPAGSKVDVYCRFDITNTYIKTHLMPRLPIGVPFSSSNSVTLVNFPVGAVYWSNTGTASYGYGSTNTLAYTPIVPLQVDRSHGQIVAPEPLVKANNSQTDLDAGGSSVKPYVYFDAIVPYSKGPMQAVCPPDIAGDGYGGSGYGGDGVWQYEGTAYTVDGIERTWYEDVDAWLDPGEITNMEGLARMILDTLKDAKIDGYIQRNDLWLDALDLNMRLNLKGVDANLETMNCPLRGVSIVWPPADGATHWVTGITWNNQRRMATGESLFIHPAFNNDPRGGGGFGGIGGSGIGDSSVFDTRFGPGAAQAVAPFMTDLGMPFGGGFGIGGMMPMGPVRRPAADRLRPIEMTGPPKPPQTVSAYEKARQNERAQPGYKPPPVSPSTQPAVTSHQAADALQAPKRFATPDLLGGSVSPPTPAGGQPIVTGPSKPFADPTLLNGPTPLSKRELADLSASNAKRTQAHIEASPRFQAIHDAKPFADPSLLADDREKTNNADDTTEGGG